MFKENESEFTDMPLKMNSQSNNTSRSSIVLRFFVIFTCFYLIASLYQCYFFAGVTKTSNLVTTATGFAWGEVDPSDKNVFINRKFLPAGIPTFTQYSAYRMGPSHIRIIGVAPYMLRSRHEVEKCYWHGDDGTVISGSFNYAVDIQSVRNMTSEIYDCILGNSTGANGGYLRGRIDSYDKVLFSEAPGQIQDAMDPFKYYATYCMAPFHGKLNGRYIWEWLEYHRVLMNGDYFVFYDIDSVDDDLLRHLDPYLQRNMAEIIEFEDVMPYGLWYYGQVLSSWDCIARVSLQTRWVFMHDLDEYLEVAVPHTLHSLLDRYKDVVWMTHGMFNWNISLCNNLTSPDAFAIERITYFNSTLFCRPDKIKDCYNWRGHRKLIFNPRKVVNVQTHMVLFPKDGFVHFDPIKEMRHHHYRGLLLEESTDTICQTTLFGDAELQGFIHSDDIANKVKSIRACPIGTKDCPDLS